MKSSCWCSVSCIGTRRVPSRFALHRNVFLRASIAGTHSPPPFATDSVFVCCDYYQSSERCWLSGRATGTRTTSERCGHHGCRGMKLLYQHLQEGDYQAIASMAEAVTHEASLEAKIATSFALWLEDPTNSVADTAEELLRSGSMLARTWGEVFAKLLYMPSARRKTRSLCDAACRTEGHGRRKGGLSQHRCRCSCRSPFARYLLEQSCRPPSRRRGVRSSAHSDRGRPVAKSAPRACGYAGADFVRPRRY